MVSGNTRLLKLKTGSWKPLALGIHPGLQMPVSRSNSTREGQRST